MTALLAPPVQTRSASLDAALAWVGHDCPDRCAASIDALSTTAWFIRHDEGPWSAQPGTLVVLDIDDTPARMHRLIGDVNRCVRGDGIRVCERRDHDNGRALAAIAHDPRAPYRFRYELVGAAPPLRSKR